MPVPKIYYIRHGETPWNAEGRFQGTQDIPLNDLGRSQAMAAGAIAVAGGAGLVAPRSPERCHDLARLPSITEHMRRLCAALFCLPAPWNQSWPIGARAGLARAA